MPAILPPVSGLGRGLYVTNTAATEMSRSRRLLRLVAAGPFDRVTLYGLAPLLQDEARLQRLGALLARLRKAGVRLVAAPVASRERVRLLLAAMRLHPGVRFDALVTEDEYWNRCPSPVEAPISAGPRPECFSAFQALIEAMRDAAREEALAGRPLRLGAYLGYPTRGEVAWLAERLDHVLLDYPCRTPAAAFENPGPRGAARRDRWRWCVEGGLEVWPILYNHPQEG